MTNLSSNEFPKMPVILIPAYRPGEKLLRLVEELSRHEELVEHVIVVDDGSGEECQRIFSELKARHRVTVLRHAVNLGKGQAIKTGLNHAAISFPSSVGVVTADADGQHLSDDILKVCADLSGNPVKLYLGVRTFGGEVPWRSRLGNLLTKRVFSFFIGRTIEDTQTGLRGLPMRIVPMLLRLRTGGYEYELDMLITACQQGVNIEQIPIATVYEDQNRDSHFNPLLDSLRIYFVFLRFVLASLIAAGLDMVFFMAMYYLSGSVLESIVAGRIVVGTINFFMVKWAVFKSAEKVFFEIVKYVLLTVLLMFLTYASIHVMTGYLGINVYVAKVLTECALFFMSFTVQRVFVFYQRSLWVND